MTTTPHLEPCPFCGGEASAEGRVRYDTKHEAWFADGTRITEAFFCNCIVCGATNKGMCGHQTRELAIAAWNRRATQPQVPVGELTDEQIDKVFRKFAGNNDFSIPYLRTYAEGFRDIARAILSAAQQGQADAIRTAVLEERAACEEAIDDVVEPGWTGYECPNTFQDGVSACKAAIRSRPTPPETAK